MAHYTIFQHLYLKALAILIRTLVSLAGNSSPRQCRALVPPDVRQQRAIKIPSRDPERHILADIYHPPGASAAPLPVLVNWHGSGFVIPLLGSDAVFCARVAREAGVAVVDADYRKGPETPFPGAVDDVEDVLLWIASQGGRFDVSRVAVSGFSAGGNLALVAATKLRKKLASVVGINAVVSFYPYIDLAAPPEGKKVSKPIRPFPSWMLRLFNDCYVPDPGLRRDPAVSPYYADPADFPDTVALITCEGDVLRPEAEELVEKLRRNNDSGKRIIGYVCQGVRHGFDSGYLPQGGIEYA